jgi:competence protein ComEC
VQTPASLVAIPLLVGAAAGLLLPVSVVDSLALRAAGGAVVALLGACGARAFLDDGVLVPALLVGSALAGLSLGITSARQAYAPPLLEWFAARDARERSEPALIQGVLREDAAPNPLGVSLTVDVTTADGRPASGGVRLSVAGVAVADAIFNWRTGRTVAMPAVLRIPAMYGDPGVPDEVRSLARRGIVLVGSVKSAALVDVVARGSSIDEASSSARAWARSQLATYVGRWSSESGAIAAAILIGDRSGLSDDDQRRLQEAGTYHVIAISGGNIAILTTILLAAMRVARVPGRIAAVVTIATLVFYGQLTGSSASVMRAVTGACVYLSGRILDHRGPALNALAVAAVAGAALSPVAVFDAGFVLSFGATLGILLGAARMMGWLRGTFEWERSGFSATVAVATATLLVATITAEVALIPVSAVVFSRVTFAGLALNFAAIPLMAVVQAAAMATLAAAPVAAPVALASGYITHIGASWLIRSAGLVDIAPWLARDVAPPSWALVAAYYTCCAGCLMSRPYVRAAVAGMVTCGIIILVSPAAFTASAVPPVEHGKLRVVFLDVGQGDATLVQLPDGRTMLVDAGGVAGSGFDIGERVLAPSLRAFGVRTVNTLVVTHGDPDHIGGAPSALRRFAARVLWEGVPVPPHVKLRELETVALDADAVLRSIQTGDRERDGSVEIRVLHPPIPDWERQRVRNEDSVVLELRIGAVSIVLPGDIGAEGEHAIVPNLALGPIAVIKAPHHGSATSSTMPFVEASHPAAVVFSAGRGNRFGHPAPIVVERYRGAGAQVFRTDEDGAVVMDTDGTTIEVSTWSGRRVRLSRAP